MWRGGSKEIKQNEDNEKNTTGFRNEVNISLHGEEILVRLDSSTWFSAVVGNGWSAR